MRSKCFLLFKNQLKNELGRSVKSKGGIITTAAIGISMVILALYAFLLSLGFTIIGMGDVIPSYGIAITGLVTLFFTALKSNGVLFAYKEYDMVMSLPVKTSTVIASRFMTMYIMNLLVTALVMIPMGIGYVMWTSPGITFYLKWTIGILAAPFVPTTLAAVLGTLIILFSSRFRYANAVVTVLSFIIVIGVLVLSMAVGQTDESQLSPEQMQSLGALVSHQINRLYLPAALFYRGIVENHLLSMAAFAAGSFLWYYAFIKLISPVYKRLNTALTTYHARADYTLKKIKSSSQVAALYRKEVKRFFSSSMYCLNMGMGCVMTIICAVWILFMGQDKINMVLENPQIWEIIIRVLPFAAGAVMCMTCTTCISLSLEGKNLWILKSIPVEDVTIYKSKILFNLSLQIPTAFLAALFLNIRLPLPFMTRIMLFVTPVVYALFNSVYGMLINLKMPDYTWSSEAALIKRSLPSVAGTLGSLVAGGIPVIIIILLRGIDGAILTIVITALIGAGAWSIWNYVKRLKI